MRLLVDSASILMAGLDTHNIHVTNDSPNNSHLGISVETIVEISYFANEPSKATR